MAYNDVKFTDAPLACTGTTCTGSTCTGTTCTGTTCTGTTCTGSTLLYLTNIKIGSATIEETNDIKFLGIILDKHHTFKNHVDVIARKIFKSLGILFKLSKYLSLEIIKTSYYFNSFLLYVIEVWHGT